DSDISTVILNIQLVWLPIGSGNELNIYFIPRVHGSIPTEGKNSTSDGVEKIVRWQFGTA
ncbi:hypothetical protein A2U01_0064201, partial [Trifolium medium]|nr:hypothetical protein [Trifolium medium]